MRLKKVDFFVAIGALLFCQGFSRAFEFCLIDSAETIKQDRLLVGIAAGFKEAANSAQFTKAPSLLMGLGLHNDLDVRLNYYYLLLRHSPGFQHQSGSGDTVVALRYSPIHAFGTKIGLQVKAKVPSASDQKGLGTKETDLYILSLLSRKLGNFTMDLNLGGAILGDPRSDSDQDLVVAGVGIGYPVARKILLEAEFSVNGDPTDVRLSGHKRFNSRDILKAGMGVRFPTFFGMQAVLFTRAGLNEYSPNYEVSFGFCRTFDLP